MNVDQQNVAIEFTLTAERAAQFIAIGARKGPDPYSDLRSTDHGQDRITLRLLVHRLAEIDVYIRGTNAVGEEVWDLMNPNVGATVGHLTVWRRVAMALALRMLIGRVGPDADKGYTARTTDNGAVIIDLGEI